MYCWNEVISTNFMPFTGIVEVALRNRFHLALSRYAMAHHAQTVSGTANSNSWYEALALRNKSADKVKAVKGIDRRHQPVPLTLILCCSKCPDVDRCNCALLILA